MFTRTRVIVLSIVVAMTVLSGVYVAQATDRPLALVVVFGLGALLVSIMLVVASGSRHGVKRN
jgi:hypothetical protein